jgi:transposase
LEQWLRDARASQLPPFASMANGIRADRAAVEAALTLPWSNGPTEGHNHRVKLPKVAALGTSAHTLQASSRPHLGGPRRT